MNIIVRILSGVIQDRDNNSYDRVYGAGGQVGLTYVPWNGMLTFKYLEEFGARNRFEGQLATFTMGFGKAF